MPSNSPNLEKGPSPLAGSGFDPANGRRGLKTYPLNEAELQNISVFSGLTALFSSIGTGCLGLAYDIYKDIDLAGVSASQSISFWQGVQVSVILFGALAYVIAGVMWSKRGSTIKKIQDETRFG